MLQKAYPEGRISRGMIGGKRQKPLSHPLSTRVSWLVARASCACRVNEGERIGSAHVGIVIGIKPGALEARALIQINAYQWTSDLGKPLDSRASYSCSPEVAP